MALTNMSGKEKKTLAGLALWLIAGAAMVIMGIAAVLNRDKAIQAVSGALGVCALITGIVTLIVRITETRLRGAGQFGIDWLIWLGTAFLLFNTEIFSKVGKLAFIILGISLICEGVRSFLAARRERDVTGWYIPRVIFAVALCLLGIGITANARVIFESMIVLFIGVYFIVHGCNILYEWLGRVRYFRNFRGLENDN